MTVLKTVFGSLAGFYCCSRLAAGFAVGSPSFTGLQHYLKQSRPSLESPDYLWHLRSAESIVPEGLDEWIQDQRKTSFRYLLENIGPNGTNAKDTPPGTVLASPSREAPNYYYQWVRDAAITMGDVVKEYGKTADPALREIIDYYADMQGLLQNTFNPSGGYTTGGLGEPKFMVDGAPFTEFVSTVYICVQSLRKTITNTVVRYQVTGDVRRETVLPSELLL